MNKIICDICGTSYPDTADQCPICGYSREMNGDNILADVEEYMDPVEIEEEEEQNVEAVPEVAAPAEILFDEEDDEEEEEEDEDDDEDDDEYDEDDDDEDDDDDDEPRSNTGLIVILVILIVALLAVSGFIFWRYFLPNLGSGETEAPTTLPVETTEAVETTVPTVPCTDLTMTSEGIVVLEEVGANWLINVAASPENTTDKILYASSDESVATVNEAGKVTAVGQGEAVITITCGEQLLQCKVTCFFIEETTEPAGTTAPAVFEDETTAPTEEPEETTAPEGETTAPTEVPEETTAPKDDNGEITLTLNKKDISFSVVPAYYTLTIQEENIDPDEVKWSSSNGSIVIVHKGQLQIVGWGTCKVYASYKGVKAECIIRVIPR